MKNDVNGYRDFIIKRVQYFRNDAKLSARELSQRMGLSPSYVSKFEMGELNIPADNLLDAIKICGVTPEQFFCERFREYPKEKDFLEAFRNLTEENQELIFKVMESMK